MSEDNAAIAPLPAERHFFGPALLLGITVFWGLNFVAIKDALEEVPIWTFRSICLISGAIGLFGISKAAGFSLRVPRAQWRPLAIAAIGNITGWNIFAAAGIRYMPAGSATIIAYTMPMFAAMITVLWLREKLTGLTVAALAAGTLGLGVLLIPGWAGIAAQPLGPVFMLLAAASWGFGTVALKHYRFGIPTTVLAGWQMVVGGIPVFIGWALLDREFDPGNVSQKAWYAVAYSAIIPMILCYWAWFRIVAIYPAVIAAIGTLAIPVVSVIAAAYLRHEAIGVTEIVSLALVVTAQALVLAVAGLKIRGTPRPKTE